ncbi:hypothetical protein RI367_002195 [Sorochytrium milnesiophthora]
MACLNCLRPRPRDGAEEIDVRDVLTAAASGDVQTLRLAKQVDVADANQQTPLHVCAAKSQHAAAEFLVATRKVATTRVDKEGKTALDHAVEAQCKPIVALLLSAAASDLTCAACFTSLQRAIATCRDTALFEYLVQKAVARFPGCLSTTDKEKPLLHAAVESDLARHTEILLSHGSTLNELQCGQHVIFRALRHANTSCALALIQQDASIVNQVDEARVPLLHRCVTANNVNLLMLVAGTQRCEIDKQDDRGRTALHVACSMGLDEPANGLLVNSCSDSVADLDGDTPLHTACGANSLKCVETIASRRPLFTYVRNKADLSPAAICIRRDHVQCLIQLLNCAHVAEFERAQKHTLLHEAAQLGNANCLATLLRLHFKPATQDAEGHSALHTACVHGHSVAVNLLLQAGFDVNEPDSAGSTPLQLAAAHGHLPVTSLLLTSGASRSGAVLAAVENGHLDVAKTIAEDGTLRTGSPQEDMLVAATLMKQTTDANAPEMQTLVFDLLDGNDKVLACVNAEGESLLDVASERHDPVYRDHLLGRGAKSGSQLATVSSQSINADTAEQEEATEEDPSGGLQMFLLATMNEDGDAVPPCGDTDPEADYFNMMRAQETTEQQSLPATSRSSMCDPAVAESVASESSASQPQVLPAEDPLVRPSAEQETEVIPAQEEQIATSQPPELAIGDLPNVVADAPLQSGATEETSEHQEEPCNPQQAPETMLGDATSLDSDQAVPLSDSNAMETIIKQESLQAIDNVLAPHETTGLLQVEPSSTAALEVDCVGEPEITAILQPLECAKEPVVADPEPVLDPAVLTSDVMPLPAPPETHLEDLEPQASEQVRDELFIKVTEQTTVLGASNEPTPAPPEVKHNLSAPVLPMDEPQHPQIQQPESTPQEPQEAVLSEQPAVEQDLPVAQQECQLAINPSTDFSELAQRTSPEQLASPTTEQGPLQEDARQDRARTPEPVAEAAVEPPTAPQKQIVQEEDAHEAHSQPEQAAVIASDEQQQIPGGILDPLPQGAGGIACDEKAADLDELTDLATKRTPQESTEDLFRVDSQAKADDMDEDELYALKLEFGLQSDSQLASVVMDDDVDTSAEPGATSGGAAPPSAALLDQVLASTAPDPEDSETLRKLEELDAERAKMGADLAAEFPSGEEMDGETEDEERYLDEDALQAMLRTTSSEMMRRMEEEEKALEQALLSSDPAAEDILAAPAKPTTKTVAAVSAHHRPQRRLSGHSASKTPRKVQR